MLKMHTVKNSQDNIPNYNIFGDTTVKSMKNAQSLGRHGDLLGGGERDFNEL